jgi:D-alanyl-D-alanine carboxypeptidase
VNIADRFQIGSETKAMTATMIATLIEEGRLKWDETIAEAFPDWTTEINPAYRSVTLTDLLLCRGGVPEYANFSYLFTDDPVHREDGSEHAPEDRRDWQEMTALSGSPREQRAEFARVLLRRVPAVPPRTKFLYSNASYSIAAAMAERIMNQSWEELMRARLFQPLGITATFDWPAVDDPHQPWGHFSEKSGVTAHDPRGAYHLPACLWPAGGVSMSVGDYAKFLQLHLRGLLGHDGLLRAKTIQHLHARPSGSDPSQPTFAFGWSIIMANGRDASVAAGSAGTFFTDAIIAPSGNVALAFFANAGAKEAAPAASEILKWGVGRYWSDNSP